MAFGDHHRLKRPHRPERHHRQERLVLFHHALAARLLQARVLAQQARAALFPPLQQRSLLLGDFVGQRVARPDLAVRVRIACAHHGAAVFEDLYVVDLGPRAEFQVLLHPRIHHLAQVGRLHVGDRQVVARRETDHAAESRFGFGQQQAVLLEAIQRRARLERGEVVVENESSGVRRIAHPAGARVARTQIAVGVVIGLCGDGLVFHLPLPGALRAVRRHQHPFARQRIEPPVRILRPVEHETL